MFKRREERTDPSEILAPMATRDLVRRLSSSLLTRAIHSPSYHITDGGRSLSLVRNAARPHTRQFFSPSLGGGWTSTSSLPASAAEQQLYVKELMRRGQHEAVVALWEGGRLAEALEILKREAGQHGPRPSAATAPRVPVRL